MTPERLIELADAAEMNLRAVVLSPLDAKNIAIELLSLRAWRAYRARLHELEAEEETLG